MSFLFGPTVLTRREERVAELVTEGHKNKEVGKLLGTTEHVIKNYLRTIYDKTGMSNRTELALWWIKNYEGEPNEKNFRFVDGTIRIRECPSEQEAEQCAQSDCKNFEHRHNHHPSS